jgi:hypothetical protein
MRPRRRYGGVESHTLQELVRIPLILVAFKSSTDNLVDTPSTLGGFWLALRDYQTSVRMKSYGYYYSIDTDSTTASMYLHIRNASSLQTADVTWTDPTDDMISKLTELIFRLAVTTSNQGVSSPISGKTADPAGRDERVLVPNLAASNRTVEQQASVSMVYDDTVYSVQYRWLTAAFALISMTTFSIFLTYWGWWILGRPVSLDPLETARAFDAALLHRADMNSTAGDLFKAVGNMRVRYGFLPLSAGWQHAGDLEMGSFGGTGSEFPTQPNTSTFNDSRVAGQVVPSPLDEGGVLAGGTGFSGPDGSVPSQTRDVNDSANSHHAGPPLPILARDNHTIAEGLITATMAMTGIPDTPDLARRQGGRVIRRPSLKFREESNAM